MQIALTGYPLQNNIKEYYTMISWIDQPILGDEADFTRQFIDPITQGAASLFPLGPPQYPFAVHMK